MKHAESLCSAQILRVKEKSDRRMIRNMRIALLCVRNNTLVLILACKHDDRNDSPVCKVMLIVSH
jgi:hypothetical protein